MSDCFDHEMDAFDSLERCREEGSVTYDNDCNITIELQDHCEGYECPEIDEDDDSHEDYSPDVEIEKQSDSYWTRFGDPEQSSSFYGDWDGKYLIFSKDRKALLDIAVSEIKEYGFKDAKVSLKPNNEDYVLCLYWRDDERGYELMSRYGENKNLKYRWWKSNADTRSGKYSNQHKRGRRR